MCFDVIEFPKELQRSHAIDDTGRSGDGNDDAAHAVIPRL
jgi:hypothetical protein